MGCFFLPPPVEFTVHLGTEDSQEATKATTVPGWQLGAWAPGAYFQLSS